MTFTSVKFVLVCCETVSSGRNITYLTCAVFYKGIQNHSLVFVSCIYKTTYVIDFHKTHSNDSDSHLPLNDIFDMYELNRESVINLIKKKIIIYHFYAL